MVAAVKTMAYAGATPWHKQGTKIDSKLPLKQWATTAGLDWTADRHNVFYQNADGNYVECPEHRAIVASDDGEVLSVMSKAYEPVQPADMVDFFRKYILADSAFEMECAGVLVNRRPWMLAAYKRDDAFTVAGEEHGAYVLMSTSFNGTMATVAQMTSVRVVCQNTLSMALRDNKAQVWMRHTTKFTEEARAKAAHDLATLGQSVESFKAMGDSMAKQKISAAMTDKLIASLFDVDARKERSKKGKLSTRTSNMIDQLKADIAQSVEEGAPKGSQWAVLQGVTRFVDHDRATRVKSSLRAAGVTSDEMRLDSASFGAGSFMKAKALRILEAA